MILKPGRAAKLKIQVDHKAREFGVATLMATLFLPNPDKLLKVIFIDGNPHNVRLSNIKWISNREYVRRNLHLGLSMEVNSAAIKYKYASKHKAPPEVDPSRIPMHDMPGYFITLTGLVYKEDRLLKIGRSKGKSPRVRMQCNANKCGRLNRALGFLLAEHFIPNPRNHQHIIYKDRNHNNCTVDNIAWVDAETFILYCIKNRGGKKLQNTKEEAIIKCTEENLLMYYKTGDESWLHTYWEQLEKRADLPYWDEYRGEMYLYFIDRAQRFTLYQDPFRLLMRHCSFVHMHRWKEQSAYLPVKALLQTDESLRNTKCSYQLID